MSTKYDSAMRLQPLSTQVLVRLRPGVADTVTRVQLPGGHAIGLTAAVLLTVYLAVLAMGSPSVWWLIIVPLLGVLFHGLFVAIFYQDSRNLEASDEYLKKHPDLQKTKSPVKNRVLHDALAPLNDLAQVPEHRVLAFDDRGHLVIDLMDRNLDRVIAVNLGPASELNSMDDTHECADLIIQGARDLADFYATTDAFTRPPRLPGSQERMQVESISASQYRADDQIVDSPGYEQVSKDVAVACWEPWRARSLARHLEQRAEQQRQDEWLEDTKQETLERIQGKADDQLVERRRAHLERISQEE
ncbi:hypothetical protein LG293_17065 (plasmid) [Citricoccus nitrophenolicus]